MTWNLKVQGLDSGGSGNQVALRGTARELNYAESQVGVEGAGWDGRWGCFWQAGLPGPGTAWSRACGGITGSWTTEALVVCCSSCSQNVLECKQRCGVPWKEWE